jgi:hypothetical protein
MCAQPHTLQDAGYAISHVAKIYSSVVRRAAACSATAREGMHNGRHHRRLLELRRKGMPFTTTPERFGNKADFAMRNYYLARGLPVPGPIRPPPHPPVRQPPDLNRLLAREQKAFKGVPMLQQQSGMDIGVGKRHEPEELHTSLEEVHRQHKRITTDIAAMLRNQQKPYTEVKEMQRSGLPFDRSGGGELAHVKARGSTMHVMIENAVPEVAKTITAPPNPWSGQPISRVVRNARDGAVEAETLD